MTSWGEAVDAELEALYAQVPDIDCKGLCVDFCGPLEMGARERFRIRKAGVKITRREEAVRKSIETDWQWSCDALTEEGRCGVHPVRPMICRIWGNAEGMLCPYGCRPKGEVLTRAQAYELIYRAENAGTTESAIPAELFQAALNTPEGQAVQGLVPRPIKNRKRSRQLRKGE